MIPKYIFLFFLINMVYGKSADLKPKKDPKKAFYYSLIPAGGQVYNKKFKKALVIISIEIMVYRAWLNNIHIYNNYENNQYPLRKHRYLEKRNKYAWWLALIYIYGMIDSVVDANLSEFNQLMDEKISNPTNEDNNEK